MPNSIVDRFFHWRLQVIYHFEKKGNQWKGKPRITPEAHLPGHRYFKRRNFSMKNLSKLCFKLIMQFYDSDSWQRLGGTGKTDLLFNV